MPPRKDASELLDMGIGSAADVRRSYADLWRVNRWLGGVWSITRHLYPCLREATSPVTVLDIGAGSADVATAIAGWAARHQLPVTVIPLDLSARTLALTREKIDRIPNIAALQGDALQLPFGDRRIDYVISSLFLHHFPPEMVTALLRAAWRVARCGVIMSDLMRGYFNEWAWHVTLPIFARSHLTYHDGLASIRRAYLPEEMRQMAQAAGMREALVSVPLPWRMTLVADK